MKKILLIAIFLLSAVYLKSQIIATSDTINDIEFIYRRDKHREWMKRSCDQFSGDDEDEYQNFRNLMFKKERVGNDIYYVLTFQRIGVLRYTASGYLGMAMYHGRTSTRMSSSSTSECFFAITEQQYLKFKKCLQKKDGKIHKFKSKINGLIYVKGLSVKDELKSRYKLERTFAFRSDGSKVWFRIPNDNEILRLTKRLFNNWHFECDVETFNKLIID